MDWINILKSTAIQYNYGTYMYVTCHVVVRLEEIGASASKEYSLEKAMDKMKTEWKDICFNFLPYRDTVCLLTCTCTCTCMYMYMYIVTII